MNAKPQPWFTKHRLCGFCGQLAAPQHMGFAGHCSRNCMLDSLGESDSDRGD